MTEQEVARLVTSLTEEGWPTDGLERVEQCPLCQSHSRRLLYDKLGDRVFFCAPGRWTLYSCDQCSCAYLDPRPTLASIGRAYLTYYTHQAGGKHGVMPPTVRFRRQRLALNNGYLNRRWGYQLQPVYKFSYWLSFLFPLRRSRLDHMVRSLAFTTVPDQTRPPRLLDIGCGNGDFLAYIQTLGWAGQGLELDSAAANRARQAGLAVQTGPLTPTSFAPDSFDGITISHVIEHLHNPIEVLESCYRILRPGGVLWIATPNMASYGQAKFKQNWLNLDPPRHLLLFNFQNLKELLKRVGFEVPKHNSFAALVQNSLPGSQAVAEGRDPFSLPPPGLKERLLLRGYNWLEMLRPDRAEEIIILARKP